MRHENVRFRWKTVGPLSASKGDRSKQATAVNMDAQLCASFLPERANGTELRVFLR